MRIIYGKDPDVSLAQMRHHAFIKQSESGVIKRERRPYSMVDEYGINSDTVGPTEEAGSHHAASSSSSTTPPEETGRHRASSGSPTSTTTPQTIPWIPQVRASVVPIQVYPQVYPQQAPVQTHLTYPPPLVQRAPTPPYNMRYPQAHPTWQQARRAELIQRREELERARIHHEDRVRALAQIEEAGLPNPPTPTERAPHGHPH